MAQKVQVRWSRERAPKREQLFSAYAGALAALTGQPATPPECVGRREMPGGDMMIFATTLTSESWSIRAGTSELRITSSPITSSAGVTGEHLYCEGALTGKVLLSASRPGTATLDVDPETAGAVAAAFTAPFGALATPSNEERWNLAATFLLFLKAYPYPEGFSPLELLAELAELPPQDPRGALGHLWLGWQALAEGAHGDALVRLQPLVALGEGLKVAVDADLAFAPRPDETGFRILLYGTAQPPLANALMGMGIGLEGLGQPAEARDALVRGLALCKEPYPDASGSAKAARAALARLTP